MNIAKISCAGLALAILIIGAAAALPIEDKTVSITDKGFSPQSVEVVVGQKVVWKNATEKEHTVTAKGKPAGEGQDEKEKDKPLFDSGPIKPGTSWEHTFTKEGTYSYYCTMEKNMTGTVVVKSAK
jgi:plastocyanin